MLTVTDILRHIERAAKVAGTYGATRMTPERHDAETRVAPLVKTINLALEAFVHFCYVDNVAGTLVNVMAHGAIPRGVWTPWGSSGKSGLTRAQRDAARAWLLWLDAHKRRPLFWYMSEERRWYIDLQLYPTLDEALAWLSAHPMTPAIYLNLLATNDLPRYPKVGR